MWESLADKGFGRLLTPWQARREGRAHAEVRRLDMLMLAQAELDVSDLRSGKKKLVEGKLVGIETMSVEVEQPADFYPAVRIEPSFSVSSLADIGAEQRRLDAARHEINAARAIIFAEQALESSAEGASVQTGEVIDDDWLYTWYEFAGKVSSEKLQQLWGKILAGEIKSPGACSLRTLTFLRGLNTREAELIAKVAPYVLNGVIFDRGEEYLKSKGIVFGDFLSLQEIGVLAPGAGLSVSFGNLLNTHYGHLLHSHKDKCLVVEHRTVDKCWEEGCYILSALGKEVISLGQFDPDIDYLKEIGALLAADGYAVKLADAVLKENGRISPVNEFVISPL